MSTGSTKYGVRRAAGFALVLALAAPAHLPAFAQDVNAPPDVGAQKGDDGAPPALPPDASSRLNKTEAASPPSGEAPPNEGPPVRGAKLGDKGLVGDTATLLPAINADADPGDDNPFAADAAGADVAALIPIADTNPRDQPDGVAAQLAGWVRNTRDNGKRPFAVIDKLGARIWIFAPDGTLLGAAPVLVGLARGDDSEAGIGDKKLAQISPKERTTPAGRFVARFGPAAGEHKTVLWIDYADAISMHPVITTNPKEHRLKRIKSSSPADHRISFGCINVPATFYDKVVLTSFRKRGGVVYILPDTRPIQEVFPAFAETLGASDVSAQASDAAAERIDAADAADAHGADPLAIYPVANDPLAVDPPAPSADPPPADDPDQPVATQVATHPATDGAKHARHSGKKHAHRTTTALPA